MLLRLVVAGVVCAQVEASDGGGGGGGGGLKVLVDTGVCLNNIVIIIVITTTAAIVVGVIHLDRFWCGCALPQPPATSEGEFLRVGDCLSVCLCRACA